MPMNDTSGWRKDIKKQEHAVFVHGWNAILPNANMYNHECL